MTSSKDSGPGGSVPDSDGELGAELPEVHGSSLVGAGGSDPKGAVSPITAPYEAATLARALGGAALETTEPPAGLPDGRYEGCGAEVQIVVRLDTAELGIISGDIARPSVDGYSHAVSFRTLPDSHVDTAEELWQIIAEDHHGATAQGELMLRPVRQAGTELTGSLLFHDAVAGLPTATPIPFGVVWKGTALRRLGLEVETEKGVVVPAAFAAGNGFGGLSIDKAFAKAGIQLFETGTGSEVPTPTQGKWGTAQLHALMSDLAESELDRPDWSLRLLWLSKSTRSGLLGIMFDSHGSLQRQGCAVFADEIRDLFPNDTEMRLNRTAVHELGHALNLAHRFEREVGRADSYSFMNYPWRHKHGATSYWRHFDSSFDSDELEFLRHAPQAAVIPGGLPFHSVAYWPEGTGAYSPYVPEIPTRAFALDLEPAQRGPAYDFGQPVFLRVTLTNNLRQAINIPRIVLDPKTGLLEVLITRLDIGNDTREPESFAPVMTRCFDSDATENVRLEPGQSFEDNVQLTFGSAGFSFAEPGWYEVAAILPIPAKNARGDDIEYIVRSASVRIRIRFPTSREEENDADVLFRNDVGLFFALGGSDHLEAAQTDLLNLVKGRLKSDKSDTVAVSIARCMAINAGRTYTRLEKLTGRVSERPADLNKAVEYFALCEGHYEVFDSATAAATKRLAEGRRKALKAIGTKR